MRRFLSKVVLLAVLASLAVGGFGLWWVHQPLRLAAPSLDVSIEPGTLPRGVAQAVVDAGVDASPDLLYWWFRLSGQARAIKAGSYELEAGITPRRLLSKLARGEESLRAVTLVEGWTFRQLRAALAKEDSLKADTRGLDDAAVMALLGRPGVHPEGHFFPDTYTYAKGSSDVKVLRRALTAMDKRLAAAWAQRTPQVAVKSADEALILASIVEKETGRGADRPLISAVFNNRLRVGMPLQTDPTVIYGMGTAFNGNLRKSDLQTDTPWNTYTRPGLPPTPIAMPGKAALLAAVQPAPGKALYFVARGDGSSHFSETLDEHNRAVNKYQRGQ
ncbi:MULTISPECIES: endolytic transglycosylase MltG [Ramlibacter]|uniref:Endolytic murein transglycosylase n=1 Tax=Ramlibacter pinisoli TaxID=2682844 RepID=A0A6N8IXG0_9BURK|nr:MULTISPECIES: endolytic transglycosylase MltG [Ramlibacter]MBA2960802.1 endolytic transglycosylase MltG [Ramlibacter sp. CGMCC 1.13660]MVQ30750.1 endolytic transglycosylase MltG [Ramlibacter pinisoli]